MLDTFLDHQDVLWGFLVALGVVLVLTPAVGRVARVLGVVDEPRERRRSTCRPCRASAGSRSSSASSSRRSRSCPSTAPYRGILLGAALATTVGIVDDFRGLPWWGKLGGQFARRGDPGRLRGRPRPLHVPVPRRARAARLARAALTFIWIVAIMNMVNFLDGMDGLAAGICGIAGATFAIIALSLGKPEAAVLSAIVAGICLGFLRHNFYPARIFMGDSGALLLGFMLATVSIQGLLKTAATVALFFPLLVLAVPILDTSFVVAKRLKYGQPLYHADQAHLHHRFRAIGFSQRRAVALPLRAGA